MNSFKIFLLILFVGIGLSACDNFLAPDEDNQYTYDRILKDPEFAQGIMINAYTNLVTAYEFNDVATDDAVTNEQTNSYLRMATGEWTALFDPMNEWSSSYGSIVNLNYFLSAVDKVEWSWQDSIRNRLFKERLTAEAKALRGYYYLLLVTRYGGVASDGSLLGVPLVNNILTVKDDWKLPRATFQQTIDQINSDLDSALLHLPYKFFDYTGTTPYELAWNKVNGLSQNLNRIDGRVVRALRARTALLAASPAFNGDNYNVALADSAAKIAGQLLVLNNGLTGFATDRIFWDNDNDITNPEILWRTNYVNSNTLESNNYPPTLFGRGRINPTQNLVDAFPMKNGKPIGASGSGYNSASPYTNRDARLAQNILVNGATLRSTVINTSADSPTNDGLNKLSLYSTRTGYYLLKLLRVTINMNPTATGNARHFYTHMRWTEMYLAYAEAANEAFGPDADPYGFGFTPRTIIAAIRKRATITQPDVYLATIINAADMRELIRNERRLELCFEGYRFWDIRRWNLSLTETAKGTSITAGVHTIVNVENRVYLPYMLHCPIPYLETKKYSGLLQNAGW
ncbi:MAG: RagB/SusD family nutrient uptake outer membrane protein [Bacteroidales bacterium]|nr:RagB/SusD family nutrient uptake outer membrane protein [Bacteroidales bacterium]